jgi:hypothetical protein
MASADLDPDRRRRLSATVVATLAHDLQNLLTHDRHDRHRSP